AKGVVGNFPDIFAMPHFTSVSYKPVPLNAATATALNTGYAGYNTVLAGLIANKAAFGISDALAAEINSRKIVFKDTCQNKVVLVDETLTDLGPYFDALAAATGMPAGDRA